MSSSLRRLSLFSVVLSALSAVSLLPASAKEKDAGGYPLSGKVLSIVSKRAHFYQVQTDTKVYLLMCEKVKGSHSGLPECKVDDRPIAVGDAVRLREDGDWVYMPEGKDSEQGLRILTAEFTAIHSSPPASGAGAGAGSERGIVVGTGMHIEGQTRVGWSTDPLSARAHMVVVGITVGVPVTDNAPMVGVEPGQAMGALVGGGHAGFGSGGEEGNAPPWVHILRLLTDKTYYQLECSAKPCEFGKKEIGLGDTLLIRADKKWAYVTSDPSSGAKEQKFRILSETEEGEPAHAAPATDAKPATNAPPAQ
jgi:hypothetical protein